MLARTSLRLSQRAAAATRLQLRSSSSEIGLLETLLKEAQKREADAKAAEAAAEAGDGEKFQIKTFNAISPVGLQIFPKAAFALTNCL